VTKVGIIDLGICNLGSLAASLSRVGAEPVAIEAVPDLDQFTHIILPGVGEFGEASKRLVESGLVQPIQDFVRAGGPLLGICLGMQLMTQRGEEGGFYDGLGLVDGVIVKLNPVGAERVPHVGWNSVFFQREHPIFESISSGSDFYFVHGFVASAVPEDSEIASSKHGISFPSSIGKGSAVGVQFHPEKSQSSGAKLLRNFISWDGKC
jgi:imidazole glycerol-phosphate synthase subunit HisH